MTSKAKFRERICNQALAQSGECIVLQVVVLCARPAAVGVPDCAEDLRRGALVALGLGVLHHLLRHPVPDADRVVLVTT